MKNVLKFPQKINKFTSNRQYEELTEKVLDILEEQEKSIVIKKKSKNLSKLKDKPLIIKNIFNSIDKSKSEEYIKDRNKLIIELLINGVKDKEIIQLKTDDIYKLKVDKVCKNNLQKYFEKYHKSTKNDWLFLKKDKKNKINSSIIGNIKKRYITREFEGEC